MAKDPSTGPVTKVDPVSGKSGYVNVAEMEPASQSAIAPTFVVTSNKPPVVILAGGQGTRLMEETHGIIPKPMVKIGEAPMLEHVMRIYAKQGYTDFIIAAGYLGEVIENWVDDDANAIYSFVDSVYVVDTGEETQTGGRLKRLEPHLQNCDKFLMTYGDGLANVDLHFLLEHHRSLQQAGRSKAKVTLTAAHPPARFGRLEMDSGYATKFGEKYQTTDGWINAGFYVIQTDLLKMMAGDESRFEYDTLPILADNENLGAYKHGGFFQCVDTWRELQLLNQIWEDGKAPWAG